MAVPAASSRRGLYALLVALLLLATTAAALHPYALDEHRAAHPCGICVASSHGGAAPLPAVVTFTLPRATVLHAGTCTIACRYLRPALFRARAPPA